MPANVSAAEPRMLLTMLTPTVVAICVTPHRRETSPVNAPPRPSLPRRCFAALAGHVVAVTFVASPASQSATACGCATG